MESESDSDDLDEPLPQYPPYPLHVFRGYPDEQSLLANGLPPGYDPRMPGHELHEILRSGGKHIMVLTSYMDSILIPWRSG